MRVHLLTSGVLIMSLELTTDDALSCANAVTAKSRDSAAKDDGES